MADRSPGPLAEAKRLVRRMPSFSLRGRRKSTVPARLATSAPAGSTDGGAVATRRSSYDGGLRPASVSGRVTNVGELVGNITSMFAPRRTPAQGRGAENSLPTGSDTASVPFGAPKPALAAPPSPPASIKATLSFRCTHATYIHEGGRGGIGKENRATTPRPTQRHHPIAAPPSTTQASPPPPTWQDTFFVTHPSGYVAVYAVFDGHGKRHGRVAGLAAAESMRAFVNARADDLRRRPEATLTECFHVAHAAVRDAILRDGPPGARPPPARPHTPPRLHPHAAHPLHEVTAPPRQATFAFTSPTTALLRTSSSGYPSTTTTRAASTRGKPPTAAPPPRLRSCCATRRA